ncbi:hypothetical protein D3C73_1488850 [compost metagenome]
MISDPSPAGLADAEALSVAVAGVVADALLLLLLLPEPQADKTMESDIVVAKPNISVFFFTSYSPFRYGVSVYIDYYMV